MGGLRKYRQDEHPLGINEKSPEVFQGFDVSVGIY
jgi:hypothetical protein